MTKGTVCGTISGLFLDFTVKIGGGERLPSWFLVVFFVWLVFFNCGKVLFEISESEYLQGMVCNLIPGRAL